MIHTGNNQSFHDVTEHNMEVRKSSHKSFDALRTLYRYEDMEELNKQRRRLSHEEEYEKR